MEEVYCPLCKHKLQEKWEGLACINHQCNLHFKCGHGWIKLDGNSRWSKQRIMVNSFYTQFSRTLNNKEWLDKKKEILIRDNYSCRKCGYLLPDGYHHSNLLHIHHIIPVTEERALMFDNDNLITLCSKCHAQIHSMDKRSFTKERVKENGTN